VGKQIVVVEVNKETIIITYGIQTFCLHNFGVSHKTKFQHFKDELFATDNIDLGKLLRLTHQYEVAMVSTKNKDKQC